MSYTETVVLDCVSLEAMPSEERLQVIPRRENGWMADAAVKELIEVLQRWLKSRTLKPK